MRSATLLLSILLLVGCQPPIPQNVQWTGALQMQNGRLLAVQFHLDLKTEPTGWMIVGDERTLIPEVRVVGDSVVLAFAEYDAAIRARWDGGRLEGSYERYRKDTVRIPWWAEPNAGGNEPRTPSMPAVALVGSYRVFFARDDEVDTLTSARFWVKGDSLFGSFIAADGDYGLFAGNQNGDTVVLDRFNGWQALKLEMRYEGMSWAGELYSRDLRPTSFRLESRPGADAVVHAERTTKAKESKAPFRFTGVTPEGDILSESSPRFKGKVLIVDVMGTWCHNCMDSAPILERLAREFGPQGLEVVGLAFELRDDTASARKNLALFRKRYGISYTLLFCGSTDPQYTRPVLQDQLTDFYAYPTSLFLDRRGRIVDVHTGFRGPGSGEGYQKEIDLFHQKTEELTRR